MSAPRVVLGETGTHSVAATVYGLADRGARLRPDVAAALSGRIRLRFAEGYADVVLDCSPASIVVGDDAGGEVDAQIEAALPDFVVLVSAPLARGVPKPTDRRGRAALARLADGRVDFTGSLKLSRTLLRLLSVAPMPGAHP